MKQYRIQWKFNNSEKVYGDKWRDDDGNSSHWLRYAHTPEISKAWAEWRMN